MKKMAQACQEDGCSVETVSNLLDQLKAKKKELQVFTEPIELATQIQWWDDVLKKKLRGSRHWQLSFTLNTEKCGDPERPPQTYALS